jgi:hypothetical protein
VGQVEYRRFTVEEVNAGLAIGWTLASGWFRHSESAWAWFRREAAASQEEYRGSNSCSNG